MCQYTKVSFPLVEMLAYMCTNNALLSFLLNGIFSVWYDLCVTYGLPKMYVTPIFRKGSSWEVWSKNPV